MSAAQQLTHQGQDGWSGNERESYEALWADDAVWINMDGEDSYHGPAEICGFLGPSAMRGATIAASSESRSSEPIPSG